MAGRRAEGTRQLGAAASGPWWALAEPLDSAGFEGIECPRENPVSDTGPAAAHRPGKFYAIRMAGVFPDTGVGSLRAQYYPDGKLLDGKMKARSSYTW
jgi:hypothetical protein